MKQGLIKISQWFYSKRLKDKIRFLFVILVIIYITTFIFVYYFYIKKNMLDYMLESNYNTVISIGNNLNSEIDTVITMGQLMIINSNVTEYLKTKAYSNARITNAANTALYDINTRSNYVSSVYIFRNDRSSINIQNQITYADDNVVYDPEWQKEIIEKSGLWVIRINGDGAFERKSEDTVISLIRLINDQDTQKPIGIIAINVNTDILEKSYKDMTVGDRNFGYYDIDGNFLYGSEELGALSNINMNTKELEQVIKKQNFGDTEILSFYKIPNTPVVLAVSDKVSLFRYISNQAIVIIFIIIVVTVVCLAIIGVFISVFIANPIDKLMQYMGIKKTGINRKEANKSNTIEELKKSSVNLIEINQIIDELLDKEKAMRKAELEVLQEQVNPHFLYNTLSTIGDLALQISAYEIYDVVETLGSFYRRFLSKGSKAITLGEEVAIVEDYLKLQKLRYQDIFEDKYEIQEDLLDIKIPKLILQPLVENSLYHGIRPKGEKGIIKISIYSDGEMLYIVVYDSGVGMSREQIEALKNDESKKSIGFKGTMERIHYYYDAEDVFEIDSMEGEYCKVVIRVPLSGGIDQDV